MDPLNSLIPISFRFRLGQYPVTVDIGHMIPQINVREVDQHALKFL